MPQLDFSTAASQLFWLVLSFAFLYVLLSRWLLPLVGSVLELRQNTITNDLAVASEATKKAGEIEVELNQKLNVARRTAAEKVGAVLDTTRKEAQLRHAELDKLLSIQGAEAELKIMDTRRKAMERLTPQAGIMAASIVEKLLGVKVDNTKAKEAANNALSDQTRAGKNRAA